MKKVLYMLLLLVELILDLAVLSLLYNNTAYIAIAAVVVIWLALLIYLVPKLKKTEDEAIKRKLYRRLVLVMAAPIILFIILVIGFIIGLSMVI